MIITFKTSVSRNARLAPVVSIKQMHFNHTVTRCRGPGGALNPTLRCRLHVMHTKGICLQPGGQGQ